MELPKISLVTPSYNQGHFLEETILSVLTQRYPSLEYFIIDGASTDDSVEVMRRYDDRIDYWVSEPDKGQTEAINKGLARATGEIVSFINSDDVYRPGALHTVGRYFAEHPECMWICGTSLTFGLPDRAPGIMDVPPMDNIAARLLIETFLPTPSMFWRRRAFEEFGLFDETLNYSFDLEHWMRMLVGGVEYHRIDRPLSAFRLHPSSKSVSLRERQESDEARVRETYIPQLSPRERRWIRAKQRERKAMDDLLEADSRWHLGDKKGGFLVGLEAFRRSPGKVAFYCAKRLQRLIT